MMTQIVSQQPRSHARGVLSDYINRRVLGLQNHYLRRDSSALGQLAQIRHIAMGHGSAWSLFDVLQTQVEKDELGESVQSRQTDWDVNLLGEPSEMNPAFIAAVSALELFAVRMQSETSAVADWDWRHSFGSACRMIGSKDGRPVELDNLRGVIRRLTQLESAQDYASVMDILRRLTHLMNKQTYCLLDFGALAVDLWQIKVGRAQHVFFRWASDFYRNAPSEITNTSKTNK